MRCHALPAAAAVTQVTFANRTRTFDSLGALQDRCTRAVLQTQTRAGAWLQTHANAHAHSSRRSHAD
eukprot:2505860-Pleurochrysis_carterae.AAC.2